MGRTHHRVQGEGDRGAGSWGGRGGPEVLGSACLEGKADVVPLVHGHQGASARSDEVEGDGSVAVGGPEDPSCVRGPVAGGTHVRWRVEVHTLLPLVYLGAHWLGVEAREGEAGHWEEGVREDLEGGGRGRAGGLCTGREEAGGRGVLEGGAGHGGRGGRLGPGALESL